jgi:hypothetical protein
LYTWGPTVFKTKKCAPYKVSMSETNHCFFCELSTVLSTAIRTTRIIDPAETFGIKLEALIFKTLRAKEII